MLFIKTITRSIIERSKTIIFGRNRILYAHPMRYPKKDKKYKGTKVLYMLYNME